MKNFLLLSLLFSVFFSSCKKEEEEPEVPNEIIVAPNIVPAGCFVQSILAENFNPVKKFKYSELLPSILEEYSTYDEISGDVLRTYRFTYTLLTEIDEVQIDTIFQYFGEYQFGNLFFAAFVHYYHDIDGYNQLDSVQRFYYVTADSVALQGTSYLNYNDYGYMFLENYLPANGAYWETYSILYAYDFDGNVEMWEASDYQDNVYYSEHYILTDYIQPNTLEFINQELKNGFLHPPQQTIVYSSWTGTYTYNYLYTVNDSNYIIQQDVILQNNDTVAAKLYTYNCY